MLASGDIGRIKSCRHIAGYANHYYWSDVTPSPSNKVGVGAVGNTGDASAEPGTATAESSVG